MQKYETFMYINYVHFFVHFFLVQGRTGNQDNGKSLGQRGTVTKPLLSTGSKSSVAGV